MLINLLHLKEQFQGRAELIAARSFLAVKEMFLFHHCRPHFQLISCGTWLSFTVLMFYQLYETINHGEKSIKDGSQLRLPLFLFKFTVCDCVKPRACIASSAHFLSSPLNI